MRGWLEEIKRILLILLAALCVLSFALDIAYAEEETVWILCNPESYVCIRSAPKKSAEAFGGTTCGRALKTDGKQKNGFVHVVDLASEEESGWVSAMYVVHEAPEQAERKALVVSNGRLAARSGIDGKIVKWLKPMSEVTVLCWTGEWCLTDRGYVQSEYLEFEGE